MLNKSIWLLKTGVVSFGVGAETAYILKYAYVWSTGEFTSTAPLTFMYPYARPKYIPSSNTLITSTVNSH